MTSHPYAAPQPAWAPTRPAGPVPHPSLRGAQILAVLSLLLAGPIGLVLSVLALRKVGTIRHDIVASGGRWDGLATARTLRLVARFGLVASILMTAWWALQLLLLSAPTG